MTRLATPPDVFLACDRIRGPFAIAWKDVCSRPSANRVRIVNDWSEIGRGRDKCVCIVTGVENITTEFVNRARLVNAHVHQTAFLVALVNTACDAITEHTVRLGVQDPERIQLLPAQNAADLEVEFRRFLSTLIADEPTERIFRAWWEVNTLVVCSPRFNRLHVPVDRIRSLEGTTREARAKYELDEDGAFVLWPDLGVHLGWQHFLAAIDPKAHLQSRQRSEQFNKKYGAAIRAVRRESQLRQTHIPDLTGRHVGRIERGQCRATSKALTALAAAHNLSLSDYLARLADRTAHNS